MTDQEMMELAALAAGLELLRDEDGSIVYDELMGVLPIGDENIDTEWWNPKDDDGDALRLAAMTTLKITIGQGIVMAEHPHIPSVGQPYYGVEMRLSATRLAVLRAAAEVGKKMREQKGYAA